MPSGKVKATSTVSKKASEETEQKQETVQKQEDGKVPKKVKSTKESSDKKEVSKKEHSKKEVSKSDKKEHSKNADEKDAKNVTEDDSKFKTQYLEALEQMKTLREAFQTVNLTIKKLESAYKHDIKKVRKHKQKRNGPHTPTGFAKEQPVPEKLAKFIKVKAGTLMNGPRITSAVWKQLTARGLTYSGDNDHKGDKRIFRTNPEVTELFGVPASVNKSTSHTDKNGFNFCNLQKFIANAMPKKEKKE
jgi:hypothetical protein